MSAREFIKRTVTQYETERKAGRTLSVLLVCGVITSVANSYLNIPEITTYFTAVVGFEAVVVEYVWRRWIRPRFPQNANMEPADIEKIVDEVAEQIGGKVQQ